MLWQNSCQLFSSFIPKFEGCFAYIIDWATSNVSIILICCYILDSSSAHSGVGTCLFIVSNFFIFCFNSFLIWLSAYLISPLSISPDISLECDPNYLRCGEPSVYHKKLPNFMFNFLRNSRRFQKAIIKPPIPTFGTVCFLLQVIETGEWSNKCLNLISNFTMVGKKQLKTKIISILE